MKRKIKFWILVLIKPSRLFRLTWRARLNGIQSNYSIRNAINNAVSRLLE